MNKGVPLCLYLCIELKAYFFCNGLPSGKRCHCSLSKRKILSVKFSQIIYSMRTHLVFLLYVWFIVYFPSIWRCSFILLWFNFQWLHFCCFFYCGLEMCIPIMFIEYSFINNFSVQIKNKMSINWKFYSLTMMVFKTLQVTWITKTHIDIHIRV